MGVVAALFWEIHTDLPREAPGDDACTQQALEMLGELPYRPRILDIGCGPGAQSVVLARQSGGHVTALDNHEPYLRHTRRRAQQAGLAEQITAVQGSMFGMTFEEESFDIVWSEGAAYIMGFEEALRLWNRFLRRGGGMGVSELCWLRDDPPTDLKSHWREHYPQMESIKGTLTQVEGLGYHPLGNFTLPHSAWWKDYYGPMLKRIGTLRQKYRKNQEALSILDDAQKEIDLFEQYSDWYGYVFFVFRKAGGVQRPAAPPAEDKSPEVRSTWFDDQADAL